MVSFVRRKFIVKRADRDARMRGGGQPGPGDLVRPLTVAGSSKSVGIVRVKLTLR